MTEVQTSNTELPSTSTDPKQTPPNADPSQPQDADLDLDMDDEASPPTDPAQAASKQPDPTQSTLPADLEPIEIREPIKKDISLHDFISKMDDYAPIIPDAVTAHHLLLAGIDPTTMPLSLQRLLALATQKFIADVAADAYQYSRMRSTNTAASGGSGGAGSGPGAGFVGVDAAGGTGAGAATATGTSGKAGGKDDKGKGGLGHVLGVQRAGYGGGGGGGGAGSGRAVLTMEDLGCAVAEYGVNVKRGEFYR